MSLIILPDGVGAAGGCSSKSSDNPIVPTPDSPIVQTPTDCPFHDGQSGRHWDELSLNFGLAVRLARLLGSISTHVQLDVRRVASFF
jgi:hypothetical protein